MQMPGPSWRAGSWDRFLVPPPLARVRVAYGAPFEVGSGPAAEQVALAQGSTGTGRRSEVGSMARRRGNSHRLIRWLWTSRRIDARLARTALLPVSALWRTWMETRAMAYRRGWLPVTDLPLPSVAVGNLTVGGSGKTPIAMWIARYYAERGLVPGILLRGYRGGDEARVHSRALPSAHVVADPDRVAGAERALARGATVLVLDDAYQRLDVRRDLNVLVVSAETTRAVRWPLPAGPWRERLDAVDRADLVVVTRKRASREVAEALAAELRAKVTGARWPSPTSGSRGWKDWSRDEW